jgi:hypothetical protein
MCVRLAVLPFPSYRASVLSGAWVGGGRGQLLDRLPFAAYADWLRRNVRVAAAAAVGDDPRLYQTAGMPLLHPTDAVPRLVGLFGAALRTARIVTVALTTFPPSDYRQLLRRYSPRCHNMVL